MRRNRPDRDHSKACGWHQDEVAHQHHNDPMTVADEIRIGPHGPRRRSWGTPTRLEWVTVR